MINYFNEQGNIIDDNGFHQFVASMMVQKLDQDNHTTLHDSHLNSNQKITKLDKIRRMSRMWRNSGRKVGLTAALPDEA